MSRIMNDPNTVLQTIDDLKKYLDEHKERNDYSLSRYHYADEVKCVVCIDCIREIETTGEYPYNARVWELARKKLGLPYEPYNTMEGDTDWHGNPVARSKSDVLSWLVYLAQQYKLSEDLINAGYENLTKEFLVTAFTQKKKVAIYHGGTYNVRMFDNKYYLMKPKARIRAIVIENDMVAKMVSA